MTYKVVFMNLKHGVTINVNLLGIGSPTVAPILCTGIWPDRRGGGRAFDSLSSTLRAFLIGKPCPPEFPKVGN